jgi:hypothetical protein
MSALPPKADIRQRIEHVWFVPSTDVGWSGAEKPSRQLKSAIASPASGAMSPEELANRHHLPMGRWVVFQLAEIAAFGEHLSIVHDNGTEGIVAKLCVGDRFAH